MIDPVMRFNRDAAPAKLAELARVGRRRRSAESFVPWLTRAQGTIGIAADARRASASSATRFRRWSKIAEKDICHQTNPRPCTPADFERLFEEAM